MSIKILLLEDDLLFGETLVDLLEEEGYEVLHYPNGQDALDATYDTKFDIYLLDINVPLIDGISLLGDLRSAQDETPAIFLTSHKEKEMLHRGFVSGCDDFLTKPFDNAELLFRIQALMKRTRIKEAECIGELCHDKLHKCIYYNKTALELSKKEYELLVLLMNHVNSPVPKELIYEELWTTADGGGSDGAIRVYINRLKQLLPTMCIENIRGIGYKLVS
ncbi:response regulator transcription factor [Sulfurimonas sp. SWIR-19]|uniref:response regulator transcription factor n=1 Tax=Sulfurimonas sp. SWIR-19 TaxID=2878390 RepID=UPI001CF3279A|nr:response regulator transcription factor [Sulfurimonas sp. SWIR-19]UCN00979.1 response regulator transcription factor [Sulfurimonas sp. SWIR-19]